MITQLTDGYEASPRECIRKWIRVTDTVLEIGAGIGGVTSELAKYAGSVIALEPQPTPFRQLKYNVSGVAILPVAASIDDEAVRMMIYEDWHNSHVSDEARSCVVPSVNINRLIPAMRATALVMDCEGYEAVILSKLDQELLMSLRLVALEQHPEKCNISQLEYGYDRLRTAGFTEVASQPAHPEPSLLYRVFTKQ